jgi:hypothetical protein
MRVHTTVTSSGNDDRMTGSPRDSPARNGDVFYVLFRFFSLLILLSTAFLLLLLLPRQ